MENEGPWAAARGPGRLSNVTAAGYEDTVRIAYNSPHLPMEFRPRPRLCAASLIALFVFACAAAWAQGKPADQPARTLAKRIFDRTGPGAISLDFNVIGNALDRAAAADARRMLESELSSRGVRLVTRNAAAAAAVTVSVAQNAQGAVWVAQVRQGSGEPTVIILPVERSAAPPAPRPATSTVVVRKTLLWTQEQPILDVARVEGGSAQHLLVLDPYHVTLYRWQDNRWDPEQVLGVYHARPWPRDLRGRLVLRRDHLFDAYLPGVVCASSNASPISMTCREADDPWPLSEAQGGQTAFFSPVRNFFNGTLVPGVGSQNTTAPFYDAVALPRPGSALLVTTALDGTVHLLDGASDQQLRPGWGTALAAVRSNCGGGWQVLTTGAGDYSAADTVTPVEFNDSSPVAAGEPAEFSGPVMELWDSNDPATAIAIVHNLGSDQYEAYALTVACSQ